MTDNLPARLEPQQPALTANRRLTELTVDEMSRVSVAFEKSQTFKNNGKLMHAAEIFVIILAGQEMGLGPSQAVMGIRMIEGKPELSANTQAALLKATGKYDYRVTWGSLETDADLWCEVNIFSVADGSSLGVSRFTKADAVHAGIWKNVWLKYPRNMLFARAISNAIAWFAPDATMVRTYHEGESDPRAESPPEVPSPPAGQTTTASNATVTEVRVVAEPPATDDEKVLVGVGGATYDRPDEEVDPTDVSIEGDPGPVEPENFQPTDEVPFDYDPVTPVQPPPTVVVDDNVRTATPGQISLLHVLARNAGLSEEAYREALFTHTGERHADKVPFNKVDDAIKALKAMAPQESA